MCGPDLVEGKEVVFVLFKEAQLLYVCDDDHVSD